MYYYFNKGDISMTSVNISSLRANLYSYADNVLNYGDSLEVRTKKGDLINEFPWHLE